MSNPFPTTHDAPPVALVLAGGKGSRLSPLTDARSKPSVPFGGNYKIIDVVLSNLAHSGFRDVWIVEQYRPFTLNQHLAGGRPWDLDGTRHGLRILPPGEGRDEDGFATGNGHALYQQIPVLESFDTDTVMVLSADHLYQMDFRPALEQHKKLGSDLTIITTKTSEDPSRFGVVQADSHSLVTDYNYKPENPKGQLVATEVFIFNVSALRTAAEKLIDELKMHENDETPEGNSLGDYGETIVPYLVEQGNVHEYRLEGYWRDIGTIDAYFQAHMDLVADRGLELHRPGWEVISNPIQSAPAFIGAQAKVQNSLISQGATVYGAVSESVIGPGVRIEAGAVVNRSVLLGDCVVPAGAHLESVVADIAADIPATAVGQTKPGPGNITVLAPKQRGPEADGADHTLGE